MTSDKFPRVGVGLLIFKNEKVLISLRTKPGLGNGVYAGPGGHLEFGETIEECAMREAKEETGMEIQNVTIISLVNFFVDGKHYVDIGVKADWKSGEPLNLEPEVQKPWEWHDIENLPSPIWKQVEHYIISLKTGTVYQGTITQ